MKTNRFRPNRLKTEPQAQRPRVRVRKPVLKFPVPGGVRIGRKLGRLENQLGLGLLLLSIGLVYVFNSHAAERLAREEAEVKAEIRELQAEYTRLNARLSAARKRSNLRAAADSLGLAAPERPPFELPVSQPARR